MQNLSLKMPKWKKFWLGLLAKVDVGSYAKPELSWREMQEIRKCLEKEKYQDTSEPAESEKGTATKLEETTGMSLF